MDLFANSGVDLPPPGGGRVMRGRAPRVPLFNYKVVEDARRRIAFAPTREQRSAARDYARLARSAAFAKRKETSARPVFIQQVLVDVLGWRPMNAEGDHTLAYEHPIRGGAVDTALGRFRRDGQGGEVVAPFELKGPGTADLDAIMPGRRKSPVQQAWDYAIDTPGARWVLVSNCLEIRLYGFGRGRDACELFDLTRLDDEDEHARLWMILSAARLLGGDTDRLLRDTDNAYTAVTNELYARYKALREQLIQFLRDSADGPKLTWLRSIEAAQTLLDRILFIAFAERTDLLPDRLLHRASTTRNEFAPAPLWENFRNLFRFVDVGRRDLAIPAYNGGLFAPDAVLDGLVIPDPLATDLAELGRWDYRREVPVTVLGHIFEQSVTDIEALKAEAAGRAAPRTGKRKRDGIVYTPDMITRFLVEKTIGATLKERFDTLWHEHGMAEGASEATEKRFWTAYLACLRDLTVVDPACGSGAFLVAAYDALAQDYRRAVARLEALGESAPFDWVDEIVTRNLYGVDLNPESVEISRLSLWLKTARRDHRLQNLEATIRVGDSLIDDPGAAERAFDWRAAFPEVFARGGFDVVVGNPPYVRMELIKPIKPYLEKHYVVAHGQADLYAYFFERGVSILKAGGRLGYVSSSTFFRTGSGENLRTFLGDGCAIECVVDFGDLQVFEGVTTYPAILVLRREEGRDGDLSYLALADTLPGDLSRAFAEGARTMPRARLGAGSWRLETDALAALRAKIAAGRPTLGEVYGPPLYGIKTGLNEAFVIDRATRDRLILADPRSADLLKPFLRGENVKRWRVESEDLWLIFTRQGTDIDAYPAIKAHLQQFRAQLEPKPKDWDVSQEWNGRKGGPYQWFEIQDTVAYWQKFESPKIVFGHFASNKIFAWDEENFLSNDKSYIIPDCDIILLAFLNSKLAWFYFTGLAPAVRGGYFEQRVQYIQKIPVSDKFAESKLLSTLAQTCTNAARERLAIQTRTRRRFLDLATGARRKPTGRLDAFWTLNFSGFLAEVKKSFGVEIRPKERGDWETFLAEASAEVKRLTAEIETAERAIDAEVYRLFDLTPAEIALVEAAVQRT